jgi:hypothetical protein
LNQSWSLSLGKVLSNRYALRCSVVLCFPLLCVTPNQLHLVYIVLADCIANKSMTLIAFQSPVSNIFFKHCSPSSIVEQNSPVALSFHRISSISFGENHHCTSPELDERKILTSTSRKVRKLTALIGQIPHLIHSPCHLIDLTLQRSTSNGVQREIMQRTIDS